MQVVDSEGYLKVKLVGGPVGPFVPYTGATANVNLGEYEIKAGQFTLDTSPTGTAVVGTTRWNDSIGSSETTLKGGSVILKNGVDLVARVVNKVTPNTTLTKANYTAVRISGAQGQRLAVAYAQANNDANSADTIGLVAETIPTNQEGFIITVGNLEGINTTGALQGETWADGDVLYLSPTTPGAITNIKPNGSTGHIIVIGYVEYAHAINGKIYVKIMNGWELDELHNVYINPATLANNNILQYDSADQLWKNKVLSTGITIGSTAIASGSVGRILFEGAGNVVQESSSLFWDNAANRFQVGTGVNILATNTFPTNANSPYVVLGPYNANFGGDQGALFNLTNNNTTGNSAAIFRFGMTSPATGAIGEFGATSSTFSGFTSLVFFNSKGAFPLAFLTNDTERLRIHGTTGNVGIGTTTDAGFRLDVNGTARVQGDTTITKTGSALSVGFSSQTAQNSFFSVLNGTDGLQLTSRGSGTTGNMGLPANSAEILCYNKAALGLILHTTSYLAIGAHTAERMRLVASTGNVLINTTTDAGFRLDVNGTARVTGSATIQTLTVGLGAGSQSNNTVLGLSAFSSNTSGNFNVAIGPSALFNHTTGTGNIGIGHFAAVQISNGANNVAIGREALSNGNSSGNVVVGMQACNTTTGNNNVVLGLQAQAGNFSGSVVLGRLATATANNQFVVGSSTSNVGAVVTETNVSTQYWEVVINGVTRKVLLA